MIYFLSFFFEIRHNLLTLEQSVQAVFEYSCAIVALLMLCVYIYFYRHINMYLCIGMYIFICAVVALLLLHLLCGLPGSVAALVKQKFLRTRSDQYFLCT